MAASAAPAMGQAPTNLEPASGTSVPRGTLPSFVVDAPEALGIRFVVSSSRRRHSDGELAQDVAGGVGASDGDGTFRWRLPVSSIAVIRPGRYWWQAVAVNEGGSTEAGPVSSFSVRLPGGARERGPIPARFGRQGRGSFAVSRAGIPRGVAPSRLWRLAARSARRWGLRATGWTNARPRQDDGRNVLGFGRLPRLSAGLTNIRSARRYVRITRCDATRCVVRRRHLGTVILERDVVLNDRLPWEPGPAYPWLDEVDLESVILHELGHFAGNRRHARMCSRSPLAVSADFGDWWRSPIDRFSRACTRVRV